MFYPEQVPIDSGRPTRRFPPPEGAIDSPNPAPARSFGSIRQRSVPEGHRPPPQPTHRANGSPPRDSPGGGPFPPLHRADAVDWRAIPVDSPVPESGSRPSAIENGRARSFVKLSRRRKGGHSRVPVREAKPRCIDPPTKRPQSDPLPRGGAGFPRKVLSWLYLFSCRFG